MLEYRLIMLWVCVEDVSGIYIPLASQRNTLSTSNSEEWWPFVTSLEPQDNFLAKIAGSVLQDCGELWIKRSHALTTLSTGGHGELHNRWLMRHSDKFKDRFFFRTVTVFIFLFINTNKNILQNKKEKHFTKIKTKQK